MLLGNAITVRSSADAVAAVNDSYCTAVLSHSVGPKIVFFLK